MHNIGDFITNPISSTYSLRTVYKVTRLDATCVYGIVVGTTETGNRLQRKFFKKSKIEHKIYNHSGTNANPSSYITFDRQMCLDEIKWAKEEIDSRYEEFLKKL